MALGALGARGLVGMPTEKEAALACRSVGNQPVGGRHSRAGDAADKIRAPAPALELARARARRSSGLGLAGNILELTLPSTRCRDGRPTEFDGGNGTTSDAKNFGQVRAASCCVLGRCDRYRRTGWLRRYYICIS